MKKVALSLLAFTLVGALAVAQDAPTLKLSGYLNTGAEYTTNGAYATIWGDDAGNAWGRFDLNGSYGTATNGVEWKLRTANDTTAPTINYAYAWSKFLDGMVTVKAGHVDDGTFTSAGDIGKDLTDANSILVSATPVAGLSVGASWFLNTGANSSSPQLGAYAAFTADKLAKAEVSAGVFDSKLQELVVGGAVLAVDKLTLSADADLQGLGISGNYGFYTVSEVVSYAVTDALSAGVVAYQYIYGSDIKNAKGDNPLGYNVKPNVSYTVDPMIAVSASVKYEVGDQGTGYVAPAKHGLNDDAVLELNPAVTFTLSPAAKIITSVVYDSGLTNVKYGTESSQTVVKVDFRYNF